MLVLTVTLVLVISDHPKLLLTFNDIDYVMAGGTDGVKCGHTCCLMHDCTIPLSYQQDQFFSTHKAQQIICCIQGCQNHIEAGNHTCTWASHHDFERSQH